MTNVLEIWQPIAGYEALYEVSNLGRIKSCERYKTLRGGYKRFMPETIKRTPLDRYGYPCVKLCKKGKKQHFTVHHLVASAFILNPDNKPTVNHKRGIKTDNRATELEWATVSEQMTHALKTNLCILPSSIKPGMLGKFGKDHNQSKAVIQMDAAGNTVKEWDCAADAQRESGFTPTHISRCCKGFAEMHKGFKWQFKKTA